MSLWQMKQTTVNSLQEIEDSRLLGELKVIRYHDDSVDITIAIDLKTLKSYVLEYNERIR